jgi:hypothetical protein
VIQGTVPVVEDADAIPELGILLGVGQEVESLLVGGVGLLQVVLHEVAMAEGTPYLAVVLLKGEHALEVFDGLK